jgi:hypothetical protein
MSWLRGNGQSLSSLGSSSRKNFSTIGSRHALPKTMLVSSLPFGWLIRSFHFRTVLWILLMGNLFSLKNSGRKYTKTFYFGKSKLKIFN